MVNKMIKTSGWQNALINAVTEPLKLLEILNLDHSLLDGARKGAEIFSLKVPMSFIDRMKKGDPNDPLLRQVLPLSEELLQVPGFSPDFLREKKSNPVPGLLHKYHGRVLLIFAGSCGINCRFCLRREFPYAENNPGMVGWDKALNYIADDKTISEVILSGGDPLIATDGALKTLTQKIAEIPHVERLRVHTRMPIVLPERVTDELIEWLIGTRLQSIVVMHSNHPNEINAEVKTAMMRLKEAGITLLNHTVLLKGINDNVNTLVNLSKLLFSCGVLPYYLNVLDKIQGTAHFDLELSSAKKLYSEFSAQVSGYLLPKLVYEKPGASAKVVLSSL